MKPVERRDPRHSLVCFAASVVPVAPSPTPGPDPAAPGPDLDNDGNLDRWEYVGCFENPPLEVVDFDRQPENDELTPIVSIGEQTVC